MATAIVYKKPSSKIFEHQRPVVFQSFQRIHFIKFIQLAGSLLTDENNGRSVHNRTLCFGKNLLQFIGIVERLQLFNFVYRNDIIVHKIKRQS